VRCEEGERVVDVVTLVIGEIGDDPEWKVGRLTWVVPDRRWGVRA
jgi:hypothetical protein